MPLMEEKSWALYTRPESTAASSGSSVGQAVDNKCEDCYQTWSCGFKYLSWPEYADKFEKDAAFRDLAAKALSCKKGQMPQPTPASTVETTARFKIQIEKEYAIVTEKEMKKAAGLTRLPKLPLKTIPTLQVPVADNKSSETLYVFAHPDPAKQQRVAKVLVELEGSESVQHLPATENMWLGQAERYMESALEQQQIENGLSDLVKEKHRLVDFASFLSTKLLKSSRDDENDDDTAMEEEEPSQFHDPSTLVGPASLPMPALSVTPSKPGRGCGSGSQAGSTKKSPPTRVGSSASLGGSIMEGDDKESGLGDEELDDLGSGQP